MTFVYVYMSIYLYECICYIQIYVCWCKKKIDIYLGIAVKVADRNVQFYTCCHPSYALTSRTFSLNHYCLPHNPRKKFLHSKQYSLVLNKTENIDKPYKSPRPKKNQKDKTKQKQTNQSKTFI